MLDTTNSQPVQYDGLKGKILNFLGAGVDPVRVARAVGCDPSYVSQLLADETFAEAVSTKRLSSLQEATDRDARLDSIEDKIIARTEQLVQSPLAFQKPMDAIRALTMVNGLKRRGASDSLTTNSHTTIVNLHLPTSVTSKFVVNANNQVITAGEQTLVTMGSGSIAGLAEQLLPETPQEIIAGSVPSQLEDKIMIAERLNDKVNYNELTVNDIL